ncbi:MAG: hypothetical protein AB7U34_09040 [Novosphingobium sp.]
MATAKKSANQGADGEKAKRGRPVRYRPEYAEQAYKLCLLGATDKDMADFFEVAESTINRWKSGHSEFWESIKRGKSVADANVAHALYQRAIGCSHPDVHVSNFQGEITVTELTKHYPPDTGAAFIWLKNRQPHKWRDKVEVESEVNVNLFPPKEELDARYAKALAEAEEAEQKIVAGRMERLGIKPDSVEDQE